MTGADSRSVPVGPEPRVYDVVEMPADQRGSCELWSGDEPSPCSQEGEFLFVYQGSTNPNEDIRRNAVACWDCVPADTAPKPEGSSDGGEP